MKIIGRRYGDTKKCLKNIWHVDEPRIKDIFWLSPSHINFCWVREALVLPKAFHSYRQFCLTKERRLNHPKSTQDAMKRFRTGDLWVKFAWKLYHKSQLFYIILRSLKNIFWKICHHRQVMLLYELLAFLTPCHPHKCCFWLTIYTNIN